MQQKQRPEPGIIGHIGAYGRRSLTDAAVEALENVAFSAVMIAMRVDAVLDGTAEPHVVEAFRSRCLDMRHVAAREAVDLADRIVQEHDAQRPRAA